VERDVVPERVVASKFGAAPSPGASRPAVRTRPLCAYPMTAVYSGTGSSDDEKSFSCK
jgi:feruloyl esterase